MILYCWKIKKLSAKIAFKEGMNMKPTLHVLSLSRRAGLEVMFLNFIKYMKKVNPEYIKFQYVLAINISDYFKTELKSLGVKIFEYQKYNKFDLPIKVGMKIIKTYDIEVIYGQNFVGNTIACLLGCFNKNIKVICHEHGTAWNAKWILALITYFWTRKADIIICNSKAAAFLLNRRFNVNSQKLKVIYNGVPIRPKIKANNDYKKLLFVGRLDTVKSPHTLIYMMKEIVKRDREIKLDILGDGKYLNELINLTDQLQLNSNIKFYGNVKNVDEFMAKSTLLILPSLRETLGNVIIEAAFQGKPAIASKIDGIPEVIVDGVTGVLIKPEEKLYKKTPVYKVVDLEKQRLVKPLSPSPLKLADAVMRLIKDPDKVNIMGEMAYRRVIQKFSMDKYYCKIINVLYNHF